MVASVGKAHFRLSLSCALLGALAACSSGRSSGVESRGRMPAANAGAIATPSGTDPVSSAVAGVSGTSAPTLTPVSSAPAMTAPPTAMQAAPGSMSMSLDQCGADNPAGLSADAVKTLLAGGAADEMRWLYPYDGTVFPRGMKPPTLMWDGAPGDVVYVHLSSSRFDYRGCLRATGPQQLDIPPDAWKQAGEHTGGASDPLTIELAVQTTGGARGPIREQVVIAQATLKGSIYYNSYFSLSSTAGSVFRIPPGGDAQLFLGGFGCYGCHAVSANGARLLSHTGADPGSAFALDPMTQQNPPVLASAPGAGFAGLSPDGAVYAITAHPAGEARPQGTPAESVLINDAALYQTDTGALIEGSGIPAGAMMSMFSPDGTRLVFNDFGAGAGRGLSSMSYDAKARKLTDARVVYMDTDQYPGWPFFLPDNQAVVFARGVNPQFSGAGAGVIFGIAGSGPASDLYIVDVASGKGTVLAQAMGMKSAADPSSTTPFGADDLHQHYYPTVSPVAAGGYFWVFFDSIRNYGNQGVARQLWGSALTISANGKYEADPSHPAFYVSGQAPGSGNHRAFTALDPCKADGAACETGVDCCGGFCTNGICGPPSQKRCSQTNEACETAADCCNQEEFCVNHFCAQIILN